MNAIQSTEILRQAVLEFPSVVPLLADKAEITLSAEARSQPAFRIFTPDGCANFPSYAVPYFLIHPRAAMIQPTNPYSIYCLIFMSNGHTPSGRIQPGHLGSPRRSWSWFGQVNFRPRPLPQRDSLVCKVLCAAVVTLIYPSTDTLLFLDLPPKVCSSSFQYMSSTTIVWRVTRCHHKAPRVSTTRNFSAELKIPLLALLTAIGVPHKRSACLSG